MDDDVVLNVDEGWLAGFQNCPPQGNPGGRVDEVVDLEAVARRWLGLVVLQLRAILCFSKWHVRIRSLMPNKTNGYESKFT